MLDLAVPSPFPNPCTSPERLPRSWAFFQGHLSCQKSFRNWGSKYKTLNIQSILVENIEEGSRFLIRSIDTRIFKCEKTRKNSHQTVHSIKNMRNFVQRTSRTFLPRTILYLAISNKYSSKTTDSLKNEKIICWHRPEGQPRLNFYELQCSC